MKAYKATAQCEVDKLRSERSKWQRKLTIAANKLASVQRKLDAVLDRHVATIDGKGEDHGS